jgi:hypothetical protein
LRPGVLVSFSVRSFLLYFGESCTVVSFVEAVIVLVLDHAFPSTLGAKSSYLFLDMSQSLLTCKICVKKPKFSDVSHLLTHVGSKGHLAQLHKLQVKSHQDIAPAIELAEYNQWFQEHGLGQLLSERLQNKEQKQAKRGVKNEASVKAEHDSEDPFSLPVQQPARRRGPGRPKKSAQRKTSVVSAAESSV